MNDGPRKKRKSRDRCSSSAVPIAIWRLLRLCWVGAV